jgi:molybdopterin molybdotransferase
MATADDIRMRGFRQRTPLSVALDWIDSQLTELLALRQQSGAAAEWVPLSDAYGRVLAEPIISPVSVPGFERAMMDGYAVHAADLSVVSADHAVELRVVGESLPGRPFSRSVGRGEAVRIMTGAPFPDAATAVLPVELTQQTASDRIRVLAQVPAGKHVGRVGEDIQAGETLLAAGRRLRPQDLGAASSVGCSRLPVVPRPRVRILLTGSELLPAGTPPQGFQIADANSPLLEAIVGRDGGEVVSTESLGDSQERLRNALCQPADVVLVSGGSSVGQEDFVPQVLAEVGELAIHGLALRPAAPAGLGRIGSTLVFLLPGNPVSCLCAGDLLAGRAIRRLAGRSAEWPYVRSLRILGTAVASAEGRVDYVRVRREGDVVFPLSASGAAMLGTTVRADGFLLIPAGLERVAAGETVEYFSYD